MSQCSSIGDITDPQEQCRFAIEFCQLDSVIPFGTIVYCQLQSVAPRLLVLLSAVFLLFGAIGVAAFDHLSPNLTLIAEISGLSQSLMGVTVLAFGNGSVDVFGAIVALNANEGGLAFSEIMGGALFVVSVVVGSMAIISPISIDPKHFLRDLLALALSVAFTIVIVIDGKVTVLECLAGLLMYALYALMAVRQHYSTQCPDPVDAEQREIPFDSLQCSPASDYAPSIAAESSVGVLAYPSLLSSIELNRRVNQHLHENINENRYQIPSPLPSKLQSPQLQPADLGPLGPGDNALHLLGNPLNTDNIALNSPFKHARRRSSAPDHVSPFSFTGVALPTIVLSSDDPTSERTAEPSQKIARSHQNAGASLSTNDSKRSALLSPLVIPAKPVRSTSATDLRPVQSSGSASPRFGEELSSSPLLMTDMINSLIERSGSPGPSPSHVPLAASTELLSDHAANAESVAANVDELPWAVLMLPFAAGWSVKGWFQRACDLLMAPFTTLLAWCIPSPTRSGRQVCLCMYSIGVPLSIPIVVSGVELSMRLAVCQATLALFGVVWWGYLGHTSPRPIIVACLGFVMALLWVMYLATELVTVLTLLGAVSHISSTLMGLTVFALGDSLGDFVANITVAQIGYSAMAIAACFGGPIFTMLVGINGAALITMLRQRRLDLPLPMSRGILVSAGGLLLILFYLLVSVLSSQNTITKSTGIKLIAIWFTVVALSAYVTQ